MKRILLVLMALPLLSYAGPAPEPGPENRGLRLRLIVDQTKDFKTWEVKVDLMNTGSNVIHLIGDVTYEHGPKTYADYFKGEVDFESRPLVLPERAQTAGKFRVAPQPELKLEPGKSLTASWSDKHHVLFQLFAYSFSNRSPPPGQYGLRAGLTLREKNGDRILLHSNEEPVVIGGTQKMPKFSTGEIMTLDEEQQRLAIHLGSIHGIEMGDTFYIGWGLQARWTVELDRVGSDWSSGKVKQIYHDGRKETPTFPLLTSIAALIFDPESAPSDPEEE